VVGDGSAENVFGPAGLQERVTNATAQAQYAQPIALGSVRLVTNASGAAVGSATGLMYLRARNYDPATGIFLQQDSWPGTLGVTWPLTPIPVVERPLAGAITDLL
jgi:hypothetical protein